MTPLLHHAMGHDRAKAGGRLHTCFAERRQGLVVMLTAVNDLALRLGIELEIETEVARKRQIGAVLKSALTLRSGLLDHRQVARVTRT
jgi:hypothetical protein